MEGQVEGQLEKHHHVTFNHFSQLPFAEQAMAFLNAFWEEIGDQAEFIWTAHSIMRQADMHTKGITFIADYSEGCDLDLVTGLYFYEKLYHFVNEEAGGAHLKVNRAYAKSMPQMMTATDRKQALRETDINFDNRISFLEYLLYQYRDDCDPNEFSERAAKSLDTDNNPELRDARLALSELNDEIHKYERKKRGITEEMRRAAEEGKKARENQKKFELKELRAKFREHGFSAALLKAQAIVRKFSKQAAAAPKGSQPEGTAWWLDRELKEKKKLYGDHPGLMKKKLVGPKRHKNRADSWIKS